MNSKSDKTSDSHRLLLNLSDNVVLKRKDEYVALSNLYTKTMNEDFVLPDGWYSVSYIQGHFKYISEKHGENRIK